MRRTLLIPVLSLATLMLAGCKSSSSTDDFAARQDAALKDPFSVGPSDKDVEAEVRASRERRRPTDVSGGGTLDLDRDAMKQDLKSVFDP